MKKKPKKTKWQLANECWLANMLNRPEIIRFMVDKVVNAIIVGSWSPPTAEEVAKILDNGGNNG